MATWTFGTAGSGLHFTVVRDGDDFTVNMLEGSMDLNALWFSDGDGRREGSATLGRSQSNLGIGAQTDGNGNPLVWDSVKVLSATGLGRAGAAKKTFLTAGESYEVDVDLARGVDLSNLYLGVRATAVNGGGSIQLVSFVDNDPTVTAGQAFSYRENSAAGAFIGSVQAADDKGVTTFRFSNGDGGSQTSADGYFFIANDGKIYLTELGAASFANDFEDAAALNLHKYCVQAGDASGNWSKARAITLNETNSVVDDGLSYLINIEEAGKIQREIEQGNITTTDANYNTVVLGPVTPGAALVRVVALAGSLNEYGDDVADVNFQVDNQGTDTLLPDVAAIELDSYKQVYMTLGSASVRQDDGTIDRADRFMASLEQIHAVAGRIGDGSGQALLRMNNRNGADYMPALQDINAQVLARFGSAEATFRNDVSGYYDAGTGGYLSPGADAGDNFMSSLRDITLSSAGGNASAEMRNYGGADFMKSLASLTLHGKNDATFTTYVIDQQLRDGGYNPLGNMGLNENFMGALEVVSVISDARTAKLDFRSQAADNFMGKLASFDLQSTSREDGYFENKGGDNFMQSLRSITLDPSSPTTVTKATLDLLNSRYTDGTAQLFDAANFMASLETIQISTTGDATLRLVNGKEANHDNDYGTPDTFENGGAAYLKSLKSIAVDAGGGQVFSALLNSSADADSLSSLTDFTLTGGLIQAIFSADMEDDAWFDLADIDGTANGTRDEVRFNNVTYLDGLTVIDGFDTVAADDVIRMGGGRGINSVADLVITTEGDNVRITFDPSLGHDGSILVLGVASTFDPAVNIYFGW